MNDEIVFRIDKKSSDLYRSWAEVHDCKYRGPSGSRYVGAIGGADTWMITPTGIGSIIKVRCACGATLDLTDI